MVIDEDNRRCHNCIYAHDEGVGAMWRCNYWNNKVFSGSVGCQHHEYLGETFR